MNYLIPANAKKGTLIFGVFTKFDLGLVGGGAIVTILLLTVIAIPNYHNVLTLIKEIINFFYGRRNYKWEGWCYRNEYK